MSEYNVPEGWKLVPKVAAPAMEQAAEKYWNERRFKALSGDPRTWAGLYAAMLAAAPAAPAVQAEPVAVAITEKQVMTAHFSASRLHISGTSNWVAAFAQSLNKQIAAPPAHDAALVEALAASLDECIKEWDGELDSKRCIDFIGRAREALAAYRAALAGKGGAQ